MNRDSDTDYGTCLGCNIKLCHDEFYSDLQLDFKTQCNSCREVYCVDCYKRILEFICLLCGEQICKTCARVSNDKKECVCKLCIKIESTFEQLCDSCHDCKLDFRLESNI